MPDTSVVNQVLSYAVTALGSAAVVKTWVSRRTRSADKEAELVAQREKDEDKSRDNFRDELRKDILELREQHKQCEDARKADHKECQEARAQDREEVAELRGRVEFLRNSLDTVSQGAAPPCLKKPSPSTRKKPSR